MQSFIRLLTVADAEIFSIMKFWRPLNKVIPPLREYMVPVILMLYPVTLLS